MTVIPHPSQQLYVLAERLDLVALPPAAGAQIQVELLPYKDFLHGAARTAEVVGG